MSKRPKLRTVEKYSPLYPLNHFPKSFALSLGKEIVYLLSTRNVARLEGSDWEEIFARLVNAEWKPSSVGLDDVVYEQMAWGAKTIKNNHPSTVKKVRLISGRNSPTYSYGDNNISDDLLELAVFEFDTIMYYADDYNWKWNKRNNLEGYSKIIKEHKFTWQPHGSQFTIIEEVPKDRLAIKIKQPPQLDKEKVLKALSFDKSWIEIIT